MKKVYLTKEGQLDLEKQIDYLIKVEQKALLESLREARDKGDISENAEYEIAKEEIEKLSMKISSLKSKLEKSEIIYPQKSDKVHMLSKVSVRNKKTNSVINWILVPENEVNIKQGKISFNSPIGNSLLGKKVGEVVKINIPVGEMELEVLTID